MALEQSYTSQPAGSGSFSPGPASTKDTNYWKLSRLRKCYTDYQFNKRDEINEQIDARRYYHGSQLTAEQLAVMKKRKQPIMVFNRIGRKVDGVVGLLERLRQDPKAYARTPQHEEGAELATAVVRYVLDEQRWKEKSPECASDGAIDGIGGIAIELEPGDQGDPEVGFEIVDTQAFFYDPRSYKSDFSDARYMGVGKWMDTDTAKEMFPDAPDDAFAGDSEMVGTTDRETRWFQIDDNGETTRVRIIDIWYRHEGQWCYCIFSGNAKLQEGHSYLTDEKGQTFCKYIMFSGNVDQDGDRYGFVRNMKSPQDGINAKQSRMQFILASKRLIVRAGAVTDIEKTRREYARPDGVVEVNGDLPATIKTDDQTFDFTGLGKLLELNLAEIENFGPNPALIGQGIENKSGRAIGLLQQAGMAELGPYILAHRGWKLRVYRGIFNAVKQHWTGERWVRVTDDEGLAQFIQINGLGVNPQTGEPAITNAIGSLDVDIILDEAPDAVTLEQQSFEVIQTLGPQFAVQYPDIFLELSPLDSRTKKMIREKQQQSQQAQQPAQQLQMMNAQAEIENTQADSQLKAAQAAKALADAHAAPLEALLSGQPGQMQPQDYEVPPELQNAQAMADIAETQANTAHKQAQAFKTHQEGLLAPQQVALEQMNAQADRMQAQHNADADRKTQAQIAKQRPRPQGQR